MLAASASRRIVMTRLRGLAMMRGPLAVRTWGVVFAEVHVAGPVQPVFEASVATDHARELGGFGLGTVSDTKCKPGLTGIYRL
jgi:hypothetical protein